jgi:hypothetical protein
MAVSTSSSAARPFSPLALECSHVSLLGQAPETASGGALHARHPGGLQDVLELGGGFEAGGDVAARDDVAALLAESDSGAR